MFLTLDCKEFEKDIIWRSESRGGAQYVFRFDNGYGALVVTTKDENLRRNRINVWEFSVIKFKRGRTAYMRDNSTVVAGSTIKYCDTSDIIAFLREVEGL